MRREGACKESYRIDSPVFAVSAAIDMCSRHGIPLGLGWAVLAMDNCTFDFSSFAGGSHNVNVSNPNDPLPCPVWIYITPLVLVILTISLAVTLFRLPYCRRRIFPHRYRSYMQVGALPQRRASRPLVARGSYVVSPRHRDSYTVSDQEDINITGQDVV